MSFQIGDYVVSGDISNVTRNSVNGWIYFGREQGLHLQLNGNLTGQFAGKRFRFYIPRDAANKPTESELPSEVASMPMQQIGVVGSFHFSPNHHQPNEPTENNGNPCFHLVWYSQNGKVVIKVDEAQLEFVEADEDDDDSDDEATAKGKSVELESLSGEMSLEDPDFDDYLDDDDGEDDEDDPDDPYGLFDDRLQQQIEQSVGSTYVESDNDDEFVITDADEDHLVTEANKTSERSFDDVIPDIDPETKAMCEHWDEVFYGAKDEPITNLFDPPIELPPLSSITTDEQAEPILNEILIRLAPLSVAFDICEHCGPLDAFRILMTEVLPNAHIHPELAKTEIVQHYGTYDYCEQCQKEYDMDFEEKL